MFNCKAECSDLNNCKAESLLLSRMFRFDQLYSSSLSLLSCSLLQRVVRLLVSAAAGYCGLPRLRCLRAGRRWGRTVDSLSATGWSSSSCNIRYSRVRLPICVDEVMAAAWSWSKFSQALPRLSGALLWCHRRACGGMYRSFRLLCFFFLEASGLFCSLAPSL
jgi:hypothetical protein